MFLLISQIYPSYRKFAQHNIVAILVWLLVMIPVGYFAGLGFSFISRSLNNIYAGMGFILLVLIALVMLQIWFKKRLIRKEVQGGESVVE